MEIVIKEPDEIIEETSNQHIFHKRINNYLYSVFINSDRNPSFIKTVYRTSKINKY